MDLRQWHQEIRGLHKALVDADREVKDASRRVDAKRSDLDAARDELAKAEKAVRALEEKVAADDSADLAALHDEHKAAVATRTAAEGKVQAAAKELAEHRKAHRAARLARAEADGRLNAFRLGKPYQPELPGTEPVEPAKIEVVAPKRKDIETALRSSKTTNAAAEKLGVPLATLRGLIHARGIDPSIVGADLAQPDIKLPPRRAGKRGAATA